MVKLQDASLLRIGSQPEYLIDVQCSRLAIGRSSKPGSRIRRARLSCRIREASPASQLPAPYGAGMRGSPEAPGRSSRRGRPAATSEFALNAMPAKTRAL